MIVHEFEARRDELVVIDTFTIFHCIYCDAVIEDDTYNNLFCSERCFSEYEEFCA